MLPTEAIKELLSNNTKWVTKQHWTILDNIPKEWKHLLSTETAKPDETFSIKLDTDTEPKLVTQLNCKTLYSALVRYEAKSVDHSYRLKWADTLGAVNWERVFKDIQKTAMTAKQMTWNGKSYIDVSQQLKD